MNDEVDRRLERLVDRKLADEPVFELAPEIDLLGETLIIDDDEKVEVGAVALGGERRIDPAAARIAAIGEDLVDPASRLSALRTESDGFIILLSETRTLAVDELTFCGGQNV